MKATIAAVTVAAALTCPASSQLLLQGVEFQVNSHTLGQQQTNAVAGSASGFVVVWAGNDASDFPGAFGQRSASSGARLGVEFQVNVYTTLFGGPSGPSVAADETGFVLAWAISGQDGDSSGVFARRFGSTGSPIASEFQVNSRTSGAQGNPSVAMSGGGFVVVWQSPGDLFDRGIFGQRFSSTGARQAQEFRVNDYVEGDQNYPSVAMDPQGFVVVWQSEGQDGDAGGIFGRRFDSQGFILAEDFQVNEVTSNLQQKPSVAKDSSGFVVVWDGIDGIATGVFARRYDSGGTAQASEFRLNSNISGLQLDGSVVLRGGSFVSAWTELAAGPLLVRARPADGYAARSALRVRLPRRDVDHGRRRPRLQALRRAFDRGVPRGQGLTQVRRPTASASRLTPCSAFGGASISSRRTVR